MNLDALVWLVAGIGVGIGLSLLLLIGYGWLERMRLGRRLKRARSIEALAPQPVAAAVALAPVVAADAEPELRMPFEEIPAETDETPIVEPDEPMAPPVEETAVEPKSAGPKPFVLTESLEPEELPPPASPTEVRAKNVEDIFAQAFAQGRPGKTEPEDSEGESKA